HRLGRGARLAHHVHEGPAEVEAGKERARRSRIDVLQEIEAREVFAILLRALVPEGTEERIRDRPGPEARPADPDDDDGLEPRTEGIRHLAYPLEGTRIGGKGEETEFPGGPASLHGPVRLRES